MVCGDKVREGKEPIFIMSNLDVNSLNGNLESVKEIAEGYVEAAKEADVVILNGEIAELGKRISGYGNFNYTWCASAISIGRKDRILDGRKIKKGDSLVGLEEPGFRSNGLSKLLDIMEEKGLIGPGDGAKPREVYITEDGSDTAAPPPEFP